MAVDGCVLTRLAAVAGLVAGLCAGCGDSQAPDKKLLSTRGLYSDMWTKKPVAQALEYEPDYPLWSDGVQKRRWLILPQGERIDTSDMDHWEFPVGTKLFKEFALHGRLLETRLVERVASSGRADKDYVLATFVWRADQSDAQETKDGVQDIFRTDHNVPPQKVCQDCHRGEPGRALGVSALQLSRSGFLDMLAERDLLSLDPKRTYEIPGDEIESGAVGYMHANCGHCHSSTGQAPGSMHLRFSVNEVDNPLEQSELYETTIHQAITEWKDHPEQFTERVVPGDPEHSAIYYRMKQRGDEMPAPDQMPPLATEKVHVEGVAAVKAWIELLKDTASPAADASQTQPAADGGAGGQAGGAGAMAPRQPAADSGNTRAPANRGDVPSESSGGAGAPAASPSATDHESTAGAQARAASAGVGGAASTSAAPSAGGAGAAAPGAPASTGGSAAPGSAAGGVAAPAPGTGSGGAGGSVAAPPPSTSGGAQPPQAGQPAAGRGGAGSGGFAGEDCGGTGGSGRRAPNPQDPDGDGDIDFPRRSGNAGQSAPP